MTHEQAKKDLAQGIPAELICATCPWDRLCVEPPSMSSAEIERQLEEAKLIDQQNDPDGKRMPVGTLMTTLAFVGRDSSGRLCPVFALRLRGSDGRQIADSLKSTMQTWEEGK